MKTFKSNLPLLLLFFCGQSTFAQSTINCEHYWKKDAKLIPSHLKVGVDVGQSPYGNSGAYDCVIDLEESDIIQEKQLYIGEVGDASYAEVTSGPLGKARLPIIYHGLSPEKSQRSRYYRLFPFFIPLRGLYQKPGIHHVWIHYQDLIPFQTGIRSGYPSIETMTGVMQRFVQNAPGLTFHLFQIGLFVCISFFVLLLKKLSIKKKITYLASLSGAIGVVFSISAIPRYFLDNPLSALKLNDVLNVIGFTMVTLPIAFTFEGSFSVRSFKIKTFEIITMATVVICLTFMDSKNELYLPIYISFLVIFPAITPIYFGYNIFKRKCFTLAPPSSNTVVGLGLLLIGFCLLWDLIFNVLIFDFRFYFISHFIYFITIFLLFTYIEIKTIENDDYFFEQNELMKAAAIEDILQDHGAANTLNKMAATIGKITYSNRVSCLEILGSEQKFLGYFGNFIDEEKMNASSLGSIISDVVIKKSIHFGAFTDKTKVNNYKEYIIIPLFHNSIVTGVVCITEFQFDCVLPSIIKYIKYIQSNATIIFSLLISERQNRQKATLLSMNRLRIHPLQIKSEEYFLKTFRVSQLISEPAFIMADLASSTPLRRAFGDRVKQALDSQVEYLFEKFKHLGITVTRDKGDFIAIVILNQAEDRSGRIAAEKGLEIARFLTRPNEEFSLIPKNHGILIDFKLKMAFSQVQYEFDLNGEKSLLPTFNLLVDSEIDLASRVISHVANPGECIFHEKVKYVIPTSLTLIQLDDYRLKGINSSQKMYTTT